MLRLHAIGFSIHFNTPTFKSFDYLDGFSVQTVKFIYDFCIVKWYSFTVIPYFWASEYMTAIYGTEKQMNKFFSFISENMFGLYH